MEGINETSIAALSSDETSSDIRVLANQCRQVAHQLSYGDTSIETDVVQAKRVLDCLKVWAGNTGLFREGRQSLTSRLALLPQMREMFQRLLVSLKLILGSRFFLLT